MAFSYWGVPSAMTGIFSFSWSPAEEREVQSLALTKRVNPFLNKATAYVVFYRHLILLFTKIYCGY
jgi:hypothetical protein